MSMGQRGRRVAGLAMGMLALALVAPGAYLESNRDDGDGAAEPAAPPLPPPGDGDSREAILRLVADVTVGEGYCHPGGVWLFPLRPRKGGGPMHGAVRTLEEGVAGGWVRVLELEARRVPEVRVRNDGDRPVLLLGGEILVGGHQDRIVRDDVLLPALSGFVGIPVLCAERLRWEGEGRRFGAPGLLAHPRLRFRAAAGASQEDVWGEIDAVSRGWGVESRTRAVREAYEGGAARREREEAVSGFAVRCAGGEVGLAAVWRGRIEGVDIFTDSGLFARERDRLVGAYVVGRRGLPDGEERVPASLRLAGAMAVRRYLDRVPAARFRARQTLGLGRFMGMSGAVNGAALVWEGIGVHVALFGDGGWVRPLPQPGPIPMPRPYQED